MEKTQYKFFIIEGINALEYIMIDQEKGVINSLRDGEYHNQTRKCKQMYLRYMNDNLLNPQQGVYFAICLETGEKSGIFSKIILETDNLEEFDLKCTQLRLEQVERKIKNIKHYVHFKDENEREEYKQKMINIRRKLIDRLCKEPKEPGINKKAKEEELEP